MINSKRILETDGGFNEDSGIIQWTQKLGRKNKFIYLNKQLKRTVPRKGPVRFNKTFRYLINVGSVGPPRGGSPTAR